MTKRTFKNFRINELNWWLNTRDFPSEIQDKQFTQLENWNFKWNKLVSSKWMQAIYDNNLDWWIKWMTVDWNDIYYVHWWTIYKNWNILPQHWMPIAPASIINSYLYSIILDWIVISYTSGTNATREEIVRWLKADADAKLTNVTSSVELWSTNIVDNINPWLCLMIAKNDNTSFSIWIDYWLSYNFSYPLIDVRYNISYYNNMLIFTSIDKEWTYNDRPHVRFNGVVSPITRDIDTPKYNTIYRWKLVFWWFNQWNAITFSQTSSPGNPTALFDFSAYSAGNQQIWTWWIITWFTVWENWLYVFKNNEVHYSSSENDTWSLFNFVFNRITSNWAINQKTITQVDQEIFYYDWINKAVRRLWYEKNLTTLRDVAISREIETIFDNINWDQSNATSTFKYPNYKLFLKSWLVWEWVNDICLVYNVENKSWTTETNKDCALSEKWFIWSAYNSIIFNDDTTNGWVSSIALSKEYSFWDVIDFKKYWEIEIAWKIDDTAILTLFVYVDGEEVNSIQIERKWNKQPSLWGRTLWTSTLWADIPYKWLIAFNERLELYDSWKVIQFWLLKEWIGSAEVSNINFRWKQDLAFTNYN